MTDLEDGAFQPEALWVARSFRGLTSSAVAERAGFSRQTLSLLERNAGSFSRAVKALAEVLRFPARFFFDPIVVPPADILHFRKNSRVREYSIAHAQAHAALFLRAITAFRNIAKFKPPRFPRLKADGPDSIENAAEEFRRRIRISVAAPLGNATRAAEAAQISVGLFDPKGAPVHGFACDHHVPLIMLSVASTWSRRRFSAMHEVGHLVLHGGTGAGGDTHEAEANRFAGAALIPRAAFFREFPRGRRIDWAALIAMKQRWGMSIQAIIVRAKDLGLIDDIQYRNAFIHIQQHGWRTSEPAELDAEQPEVCGRFVVQAQERGSLGKLCEQTRFYRENLEETLSVRLLESPEATESSQVLPFTPRAPARSADLADE